MRFWHLIGAVFFFVFLCKNIVLKLVILVRMVSHLVWNKKKSLTNRQIDKSTNRQIDKLPYSVEGVKPAYEEHDLECQDD